MAPSHNPKTGTKEKKGKKEKVFHPQSRKAGQLQRTQLRNQKLAGQASKRSKKHASKVDMFGFFYHSLPEQGVLTLDELHSLVRDLWMTRHDAELEEERAARRKGRPKSVKEQKLEEIKRSEAEEYRTGMEVLDLTHPENVALFRQWDQIEFAYIQMLRFIRITNIKPEVVVLSRPGKHLLLQDPSCTPAGEDESMGDTETPVLLEPSTVMAMDEV